MGATKRSVEICANAAADLVAKHPGITSTEAAAILGVTPAAARMGLGRAADRRLVTRMPIADCPGSRRTKKRWSYWPISMAADPMIRHRESVKVEAFMNGKELSLQKIWRSGPAMLYFLMKLGR